MIRRLYLKYTRTQGVLYQESGVTQRNKSHTTVYDFHLADKLIGIFTIVWIATQAVAYLNLLERPVELYTPANYFQKFLIPHLPEPFFYYSIAVITTVLTIYALLKSNSIFVKCILFLGVGYINAVPLGYGHFSHVGHILLLTHLFKIAIPADLNLAGRDLIRRADAIRWMYFGIFVTYTWSGIWKLGGLVYKMIFFPDVINWLHPDATMLNAIVSYREWDAPFGPEFIIYDLKFIWPPLFLIMLFLQLASFVGFRKSLTFWIAGGNILFHLVNILLFKIEFIVTPIVLFLNFLPYHKLSFFNYHSFKEKHEVAPVSKNYQKSPYFYQRIYENGQKDQYSGFYAIREHVFDQGKWYTGLLYLPGISLLVNFYLKINGKKSKAVIA